MHIYIIGFWIDLFIAVFYVGVIYSRLIGFSTDSFLLVMLNMPILVLFCWGMLCCFHLFVRSVESANLGMMDDSF